MKAILFVKPEFANKTERSIRSLIKGHPDYMTLLYLIKGLDSFAYDVSLRHWDECNSLEFDGTELLVLPQQYYITGKIRRFRDFELHLRRAIESGCSILLTHHHQGDLTDYFGINSLYDHGESYYSAEIESLKYALREPQLIRGVADFWQSARPILDEFTYLPSRGRGGFIPIVQKIPKFKPGQTVLHRPFLCLAFKKLTTNGFVFLVDVHATGSTRGDNGNLFALLLRNVLAYLSEQNTSVKRSGKEITDLLNTPGLSKTEKEALVASRIGQGRFRNKLIAYWKGCAVSKVKTRSLLRASHIKPWSVCNNLERLDTFNGLLLIPNLDQAFDQGYISLDEYGDILVSSRLSQQERRALGIKQGMRISLTPIHQKYLWYHRKYVFKK